MPFFLYELPKITNPSLILPHISTNALVDFSYLYNIKSRHGKIKKVIDRSNKACSYGIPKVSAATD
jgi:hypothetical protein